MFSKHLRHDIGALGMVILRDGLSPEMADIMYVVKYAAAAFFYD
jgi:hypothetical protein